MKYKRLLALIVCILILSGCNSPKVKNKDKEVSKDIPPASENVEKVNVESPIKTKNPTQKENSPHLQPDLSTDEGINKYLQGEWIFDKENESNMSCTMDIDEYLNIEFSFTNSETGESMGDYSGYIDFDRWLVTEEEAPDIINIELLDDNYCGGCFFYLHRTTYDGKHVMSWFFAANGDSIFSCLTNEHDFMHGPEEIVFEKVVGEKSQLSTRKNEEFNAVFWGRGDEEHHLWLDDVNWIPIEEYDPDQAYPDGMIIYENEVPESVLYTMREDQIQGMEGYNLFVGVVYFIKTDKDGYIVEIVDAEHKAYIDYMNDPD